jgi:hypothetical protein
MEITYCKDCDFWVPIEEDPVLAENNGIKRGTCHCLPPAVTTLVVPEVNAITQQMRPNMIDRTVWPITTSASWCAHGRKRI